MGLIFSLEPMTSVWPEAQEMVSAHEVEVGMFGTPDPNVEQYIEMERIGVAFLFTARSDGKLVGYSIMLITGHPHYKSVKTAFGDALYVTPEHRGIGAVRFLKWIDEYARFLGAGMIVRACAPKNDYSGLLEHLGYAKNEVSYLKRF